MKKVLLGLSLAALFSNTQACDTTSFTGAFAGAGIVVSFDQDKFGFDDIKTTNRIEFPTEKTNKTAFGGQIVLGYGYQFANNIYAAIMHESTFSSKAKAEYSKNGDTWKATQSRKVWTPSFGVALGYVVDDFNFGIRGGVTLDKVKFENEQGNMKGLLAEDTKFNKNVSMTSPYIGAYVEYKMNSVVIYGNVDYIFGKKKTLTEGIYTTNMRGQANDAKYETYHKRSAVKLALGVKVNVNSILGA